MHYLTTPAAASGELSGGEAGKRNKEDVKVRGSQRLTALEIFHGGLQSPVSFPFLFTRDKLRFCDGHECRSAVPQTCSTAVIF